MTSHTAVDTHPLLAPRRMERRLRSCVEAQARMRAWSDDEKRSYLAASGPELERTRAGADFYPRLAGVAAELGIGVHFRTIDEDGRTRGLAEIGGGRVRILIRPNLRDTDDACQVLAHELCHVALLHGVHETQTLPLDVQGAVEEIEAETFAWVACEAHGVDTTPFSRHYIAGWLGGLPEGAAPLILRSETFRARLDSALYTLFLAPPEEREPVTALIRANLGLLSHRYGSR